MQIWDIWEKDSPWMDLTLLMLSACLFNLHAKYKPSSSCCSQHSGFQVSGPVGRSCASFTLAPPPLLLTAPSQRTLNVLAEPEWDKVVKASAGELVGEEEEWISLRHYFTSDTQTRFSLVWACTGRSRSPQTLRPLNQIPQSPAWREGEVGGEVTLTG